MGKRLLVLQSGGSCPGSSDAQFGVSKRAEQEGYEVLFSQDGYRELMEPDATFCNIHRLPCVQAGIQGLRKQRCSPIGTSRANPAPVDKTGELKDPEQFARISTIIRENLTRNRVDIVIVIGGDNSLGAAGVLMRHGVIERLNGVPKTVDNDIGRGVQRSFGVLTAAGEGAEWAKRMQAEGESNDKMSILEIMGRDSGDLAARIATAAEASTLLIAEVEVPRDHVVERIRALRAQSRSNALLVIAEAFRIDGQKTHVSTEPDPFGNLRLGGVGRRVERWLNEADIKTMYACPSYLIRSAAATERDSVFAKTLGERAAEEAIAGHVGKVAILPRGSKRDDQISTMDLSGVKGDKRLPIELYDADQLRMREESAPYLF